MKLTPAQERFLRACEKCELDHVGLPFQLADMRVHEGLLHRGLVAYQGWIGEYVLTPQGRAALRDKQP